MPGFADGAQQSAVSGKAVSIAPLRLARFEHRFEVVEDQQTRLVPQQLKQQGKPRRFALWRHQVVRG
jgi:hypothetical protein